MPAISKEQVLASDRDTIEEVLAECAREDEHTGKYRWMEPLLKYLPYDYLMDELYQWLHAASRNHDGRSYPGVKAWAADVNGLGSWRHSPQGMHFWDALNDLTTYGNPFDDVMETLEQRKAENYKDTGESRYA